MGWGAIASFVLSIIKWIFGGKQQQAGVDQGKAEASAETSAASAKTEAAIAEAEASTDRTQGGIVDAANQGKF